MTASLLALTVLVVIGWTGARLIDRWRERARRRELRVANRLIARKGARPKTGMEEMDEALRDRTRARHEEIAQALLRRRRELERGLVRPAGELVAPFPRREEGSGAGDRKRRA